MKLTADKLAALAALGLEWAARRNNDGARPGDVARGGRRVRFYGHGTA
ncbi:hypothetical protein [Streptomyces brevispora]